MSTPSRKHKTFVSEPMDEKSVTELAGINEELGKNLEAKGYDKAYVVLGQFLLLKKNEELFTDWMKELFGANPKQAKKCYKCIDEWCQQFL